ncbi:MAG: hypothetical protein K6T68_11410, partial [Alicyclobacillus shizuokensis]|nr:hypothetical protein [Alicyclobacillus shizuokensis]
DALVRGIGLFTIFIALVAAIYACWSYLHKRRGINSGQFQSAFRFPILLSACLVLMLLAMVAYLLTAY